MKNKVCKYWCLVLIVTFFMVFHSGYAQDTKFRSLSLAYDISLDIPYHWLVLSHENIDNLETAGQAVSNNAGIEVAGKKVNLLAVNAVPAPTGAMIRVSVTTPLDYTQADLASTTEAELNEVRVGLLKVFKQLELSGGPKVIKIQKVRIETMNNHRMLVIPYIRTGNNASTWQVIQYEVPVSQVFIKITLSHRMSDSAIWKPILERVKRSVRF